MQRGKKNVRAELMGEICFCIVVKKAVWSCCVGCVGGLLVDFVVWGKVLSKVVCAGQAGELSSVLWPYQQAITNL